MKKYIYKSILVFAIVSLFLCLSSFIESKKFPGKKWELASSAENLGYDSKILAQAKDYSETINTSAVVIVVDGLVLGEWGEVDKKFMTHSIRKSFLSAMYGKYVENGTINLENTMEEIGIDDEPKLTELERSATIRDCLKARSGIYHDALYESQSMKDKKPKGLVVKPGTFWYYNNWDFNAAGTIFEKLTGNKIFDAIKTEIADPLQMEHYEAADGEYFTGKESMHAAYPFIVSAHDLARFGLLMLRNGNWNGKQIISKDWVVESTRYHSDATLYFSDGYGYMWWVSRKNNKYPHLPNVDLPDGTYSARGSGGHYILVIPEYDMVIVHRVDTFKEDNKVSKEEFGTLVKMILDSKIKN